MRGLSKLIVCAPLILAGCAVSPKTFYADPTKPNDTELCRLAFDQNADPQFRQDVANELVRRGVTTQTCQSKITTQNAIGVAAVLIGVTTAAVIACRNNACAGGGGGYTPTATSAASGYDWDYLPGNGEWRCRSDANGEFAPDFDCADKPQIDHWP